jgi:trans-aconitate methyltransferase
MKFYRNSTARQFHRLRARWEAFGREDPLFAVLSNPSKRGGRWELDEFFATGEAEISAAIRRLENLGVSLTMNRALDFGCGVGRLTRALAARFVTVLGIDVSLAMVEEARRLNPDLQFVHNPRPDLAVVENGSVDFLYSRLVLQHVPPDLTLLYLREFGRVLSHGGVAMFQIPTTGPRRSPLRQVVRSVFELARLRPRDFGGYTVPADVVKSAIAASGMTLVTTLHDSTADRWEGLMYVAT